MERMAFLGQRLRSARRSIGKTQDEVSRDTGISRELLSYWESGARTPSTFYLGRLADYYGLNIAWFLDPNAPEIKVAFRSRQLTDHDREVIYWARRVLSDYWVMKSLQSEVNS
ncbi:MAG TPA: helix-turn-helix transcriptional regulator [Firmicutes bacterium]|nr:helix-turn-helix transcriptional regulator [Candidatus Fermentithermobacillaceae bacterium]